MAIDERIQEHVEKLPAPFRAEVLDFVKYLLEKAKRESVLKERKPWSDFSLSSAMRGIEEEDEPAYTTSDLKVKFS